MTRKYIIVADDSLKGFDEGIEDLERKWGAEEIESCNDCISRQALRQKLQEHHDFFIDAYGGFSNLPQNDKSRVDEITNCIAMVINEPSVTPQPKVGEWLEKEVIDNAIEEWQSARCSVCDKYHTTPYMYYFSHYDYCPHCGTKMEGRQKIDQRRSERNS